MSLGDRVHRGLPPAALVALLAGRPLQEVADHAGCSERTIRRRLADPVIAREVREARAMAVELIANSLADAGPKAVATLVRLLDSANDAVAVASAKSILDALIRYREHGDLAAQLAELRAKLEGDGP